MLPVPPELPMHLLAIATEANDVTFHRLQHCDPREHDPAAAFSEALISISIAVCHSAALCSA
jgi:hypothetical protein